MAKKKKLRKEHHLGAIGFLQALGLVVYAGLVACLLWRGEVIFGGEPAFLGVVLMLSLLVVSVLFCALIGLGYSVVLAWKHKRVSDGVALAGYTAFWLGFFVVLMIIILMTI